MSKILLLGGTKMARLLAAHLAKNHNVTYSIAGGTSQALLPDNCQHQIGGFGGRAGLAAYISANGIDICIDATHPFAQNISQNALAACAESAIPIVHYARRNWPIDSKLIYKNAAQLIAALPQTAKIFLTIGGQNIEPFLSLKQNVIARMIEPPNLSGASLPENFEILLSRPPYKLKQELELMQRHKITHLICKNSGGNKLADKLLAAQKLGVHILLLARPKSPHTDNYYETSQIEAYLNNLPI
ncbi:MAG: precorrin-6A reductase [Rhizobiales bacterium]|nr:precorrin-6A reductase [Hyphomicrobiales bacterium]NRB13588.1 precorrin-6A reductase [Hyphomicrobiales bacterium]